MAKPKPSGEMLQGVFVRERYRSGTWVIGQLVGGTTVVGFSPEGQFMPDVTYEFHGQWETHPKYGRQFAFSSVRSLRPLTRKAVVSYLKRHFDHVGQGIANKIVDKFGAESIEQLINHPEHVARQVLGLTEVRAHEVSNGLKSLEQYQEVSIQLHGLLDGYGFQLDRCIDRAATLWKTSAADVIAADPWALLINRFPGAGFLRVDKLRKDLGQPDDCPRRQCMVVWHVLHSDMSGSTWLPERQVEAEINRRISGTVSPERAIRTAINDGLIIRRPIAGVNHLADLARAQAEAHLSQHLRRLIQ